MEITRLGKLRRQYKDLRDEASTWRTHWTDVRNYISPDSGMFLQADTEDVNKGEERMSYIINHVAGYSLRTLASGLHGGLTSPSRPWFRLSLDEEELAEGEEESRWLHQTREEMLSIFARSNFYAAIHGLYEEVAAFGTGAMLIEEDDETTVRFRPFTIGEFVLALGASYRADTLWRKIAMTSRQMVDTFGADKVSRPIVDKYNAEDETTRFNVLHVIRPRQAWGNTSNLPEHMQYESLYFEETGPAVEMLREGGYETCPFVAPRWNVVGVDSYGRCPGMSALPDVKQLQKMEEDKLMALAKVVDPPVKGPPQLKQFGLSVIPGGVSYVDNPEQYGPLYQVNFDFNAVMLERMEVENRIRTAFFVDLFVSILQSDKRMTATEVAERHDEKLLLLGPTIERLQAELLDPIIDRVFYIALNAGQIPPPPASLEGRALKVEYVSLLAQAQKLVGVNAINQVAQFVGFLASVSPDVMDKLDLDEMVEEFAKLVGVAPQVLRDSQTVRQIREQRRQQQQMAQAAELAPGLAQGAKNLSEIDPNQNTMLQNVMGSMAGAMQ